MVNSKEKGTRGELKIRDELRELTKLPWERTPASGALNAAHKLKGDLYIPNEKNLYCVECKNYEDDPIKSSIIHTSSSNLSAWWSQVVKQAIETDKKPLLIYRFNRSKTYVGTNHPPNILLNKIIVSLGLQDIYISLLKDWVLIENPRFII